MRDVSVEGKEQVSIKERVILQLVHFTHFSDLIKRPQVYEMLVMEHGAVSPIIGLFMN